MHMQTKGFCRCNLSYLSYHALKMSLIGSCVVITGSRFQRFILCFIIVVIVFLLVQLQSYHLPIASAGFREGRVELISGIPFSPNHASVEKVKATETRSVCENTTQYKNSAATWKKTFCDDFLVNTFHDEVPVCGRKDVSPSDQVKCYGSVHSKHMAMCSFENLALRPKQALNMIPNDVTWHKPPDKTINLLHSTGHSCSSSGADQLLRKTEKGDFQYSLTHHLLVSEKLSPSVCEVWINKTVIFHVSNALHIYFRFMDLYSVHKTLLDYGGPDGSHQVLRIGSLGGNYRFPEFDKSLFPGALTLRDLEERYNGTICFRKVILSPRSYQSIPFRCKMSSSLRQQCFSCNGRGLSGSPFQSFRARVLKTCNITTVCKNTSRLTVISRKAYKRWSTDDAKNFKRVLQNEEEMIAQIRKAFPNVVVRVVHLEDLNMCEQVRSAVEADVMVGVHGAGLVHFWWLREEATGLELEPSFESGNPSFRMLTTLAGRKYERERITGHHNLVIVNISSLIRKLKLLFAK